MVDYPYDKPAASVKIKNVTSCAQNRKTLHRIRNNDPSVTSLFLVESNNVGDGDCHEFYIREGDDFGWLGHFICENETLKTLYHTLPGRDQVEKFSIGMQRNKSIKRVEFWGDGLLGESLSAIILPHVTTMSMEECNLDHEKARRFAVGLRRCNSLVKYCGPMTAEIVASLTALPMLEDVRLWRDIGLAFSREERMALIGLLSKATTMKRLNMSYFGLGNDDLKVLAKGIACNASLTDGLLDLSNNDIGSEGLQALASSLVGNTKLRELKLANNNIGDTGLEALEDSLARNRALRVLSIAGNTAITAGGLRSVSRILQSSGLEDLCLDKVNLTIAGAFPISINKSLVSLSLSCFFVGFSIGDDGLRALALGLSYNSQLESLDLSGNSAITVSGLRSLNQYFGSPSCVLKRLNLSGIDISDDCVHALADALDGNKSLKTLYFSERGITSNGWNAFLKLVYDPSSPNRMYLSNQTLCHLGSIFSWTSNPSSARSDVKNWLKVNNDCQSPKLAAKFKILHCFPDLDMVPLFPWNLKLLPLLKRWFEETS